MQFTKSLERVHRRLTEYQRSGDTRAILSESAMAEAVALIQAARPAIPDRPTAEETARLMAASNALGWLYYHRYNGVPAWPDAAPELARALLYFSQVASDPRALPAALRDVLGPTANPDAQAATAVSLLREALTTDDPDTLETGIGLLTIAVAAMSDDHPQRPEYLSYLGIAYRERHERSGEAADLEYAIAAFEQAVAAAPDDNPKLAEYLSYLVRTYHERRELGGPAVAVPDGHPKRATLLLALGTSYRQLHVETGAAADLDRAIDLFERGVTALAADDPSRAAALTDLGWAYRQRFHSGDEAPADLDRAIEAGEQALAAVPDEHPGRMEPLSLLGLAYWQRYERTGAAADLRRTIEVYELTAAGFGEDHPARPLALGMLGSAYQSRYDHDQAAADLDRAIDALEPALAAISEDHSEDHPFLVRWLFDLARARDARHSLSGSAGDQLRAVDALERALAAAEPEHRDRPGMLNLLGLLYGGRDNRPGPADDLDRAIATYERAVAVTPEDHVDRGLILSNLGRAHQQRWQRGGTPGDLDRAVEVLERAVEVFERATPAPPDDHYNRGMVFSNLGHAYRDRYERRGAVADLDRAIAAHERAVAVTQEDHVDRVGWLSNLADAYDKRYQRAGAVADLDRAIALGGQALAGASDDHGGRAAILTSLGTAHWGRYARAGVLADLDHAIDLLSQALTAISDDRVTRAKAAANLGSVHQERYERTQVPADLDRAADLLSQAITTVSGEHPYRPGWLSALGGTHLLRFMRGGDQADLDRAIDLGEQAVSATPDDHPERTAWLADLGARYHWRFVSTQEPADRDRAIALTETALAGLPEDHLIRAALLANLGGMYRSRLSTGGSGIDRERLHALARQVTAATTAAPRHRIQAGFTVGSLAYVMNDRPVAVELLDAAVSMLPSALPREAGWTDQEHRLGEHFGLVGLAIAAHCAINDPVGAVEAAELGRGILLAAHLDSRTDLTELEASHPDLAARFRAVRHQLGETPAAGAASWPLIENRRLLWDEHDALLATIRRMPGQARFLLPPRLADLQPAAAGGAVVLLNIGGFHGEAIIITAEAGPVLVELPDLTPADVLDNSTELLNATQGPGHLADPLRPQRVVQEILGWLWDAVVGPVLDALPDTTARAPRIWWLPAGLLGLFPLHAAGHPGQPGALDRVVSSYTPTLRALAHTRNQPSATTRRQLAVALGHTPGLPDLPSTIAEAADLHADHPGTPPLTDHEATAEHVLAALQKATWAHFACHARYDFASPSQGGLHLYDGTLSIADISRLHLTHAELAYLSACSTAHQGLQHAEESIHLASAFHLAGFRHVIASLWPIDDATAAATARAFYRRLPAAPTADEAAATLRHITLELRARHPDSPDLWAPMVHSGP